MFRSSHTSWFSRRQAASVEDQPELSAHVFFNDSVVIGWVHGGFMELAAQDCQQGVIFYTLDQSITGYQKRTMTLPRSPR